MPPTGFLHSLYHPYLKGPSHRFEMNWNRTFVVESNWTGLSQQSAEMVPLQAFSNLCSKFSVDSRCL